MQLSISRPTAPIRALQPRIVRASRGSTRVTALAVAPEYGWVIASVAFTAAVTQWQAIRVMKARRECGVSYPDMYASGDGELAVKFNCVQRSHQNTLETLPNQLAMQLLVGLVYPRAAAIQGLIWAIGRILYTTGYSTGIPNNRRTGATLCFVSYLALLATTAVVGVRTALGA